MKQEKVKEIMNQLEQGIQRVMTAEEFRKYLDFMATFHNYSFNNQLLIYIQRPNATLVKGFHQWKKHNRHVVKGSKAIKILAPRIKKKEDETTGEEKKFLTGFMVVSVFDISQTEGEELPSPEQFVSDGFGSGQIAAEIYPALLEVVKKELPVSEQKIEGGAKGYYHIKNHEIVLSNELKGVDDRLSVLIHEYAHSILHRIGGQHESERRGIKEAQAESVAYVVAKYFGLDIGEWSFGYVASWGSDPKILEKIGSEIQKTSNEIIQKIENQLEKILEKTA